MRQQLALAHDDFERGDARMADSRLQKVQGSLVVVATRASLEVSESDLRAVAAPPPAE